MELTIREFNVSTTNCMYQVGIESTHGASLIDEETPLIYTDLVEDPRARTFLLF